MITDRRLVGFIKYEDGNWGVQPVIQEEWTDERGERHEVEVWFGTWEADPSPCQLTALEEELAREAAAHNLQSDNFDPHFYERAI